MKKNTKIRLGLLIIIIILVSLFYVIKNYSEVSCEKLRKKAWDLANKENYCDVDSDCVISTELQGGVFCCYILLNKNASLNKIKEINGKYSKKTCPLLKCDCMPLMPEDVIKCVDSKCIIGRK